MLDFSIQTFYTSTAGNKVCHLFSTFLSIKHSLFRNTALDRLLLKSQSTVKINLIQYFLNTNLQSFYFSIIRIMNIIT